MPLKNIQKPQKQERPTVIRKNKYQDFLERNKDVIFKALFNVHNTIKNKKEVIAKDFSKTYYRDYLKYQYVITEMKELFNIKEEEVNKQEN